MFFNDDMSIWILALLVMVSTALAGWRQGAIRAAFSSVGILIATLLAVPVGHLVHPLLPHLGAGSPVLAWALAPIVGFILVLIPFKVAAHFAHLRIDFYYKYKAGDLRQTLWERLNTRLGICVGLLNGAVYFILATFFIFNLAYWTTQTAVAQDQPIMIRLVNWLGNDLQSTGLSRTANAVGTLPAENYQLADLSGFLMQNPQVGPRLTTYPALTSFWEQDNMLPVVTDSALTNALKAGTPLGDILNNPAVQSLIANKELSHQGQDLLLTNYDDLMTYLKTGHSARYDGEKIIGLWKFNPAVTVAWLRQDQPKIRASEMRAIRAWITQSYAKTRILATGNNQLFVRNLPQIKKQNPPSTTPELVNWKGEWSRSDTNYDLHVSFNGEDKFLTAKAEGLRLTVKDGHNLLIFDRAD
jgi:uncharacterized membrane protein required for colicin V production